MSIVISILLAFGAMALIGYPLFRTVQSEVVEDVMPRRSHILDTKEVIMNTLGEIEFDYHMKKLSVEDYNELKSNYSGTAVQILKAQEQTRNLAKKSIKEKRDLVDIDREIEEELVRIKEKVTKDK